MPKCRIDYNDAYAQNFAELWTTWMLTRSNTLPLYREQFHTVAHHQFVNRRRRERTGNRGTRW